MVQEYGYLGRGRFASSLKNWESLRNFVETTPHAEIKAALKPEMETSRFITFDVTDEDIPLSVDAAKARIR